MVYTPVYMVHHMQVFRDAGCIMIRSRKMDFPIRLFRHILDLLFSHPVDEVDVAKMPADCFWLLCWCLQDILHHGRPALVLLWYNHLINVQNGNILEPVRIYPTSEKHRKNCETSLWAKKGFIESKALLKERLHWKKCFVENNERLYWKSAINVSQ